jgi:hypothetical protein
LGQQLSVWRKAAQLAASSINYAGYSRDGWNRHERERQEAAN